MALRCFPYRPHDYVYDPIFTVSGPVDHYKAAVIAKMSTAKFQICPIFPNMFSDLPNHPRVQLVPRKSRPIPPYTEKSSRPPRDPALVRTVDVAGADRAKFFCPIINFPPKDALPYMRFPTFTIEKYEKLKSKMPRGTTNVKVETKFRESEAQTIPWEPPCVVIGQGDPEILKLDFLKFGSGLPAAMHEVQLIERARMKASWEKTMKPNPDDENSLAHYRDYMEALERDEWAFREREIQDVQNLRMELLENMLEEILQKSNQRADMKLHNFIAIKQAEKEEQIAKIRKKTARELRKLNAHRRGMVSKYHEVNIIDEHADKKSELYAPLIRHGEHPKRWHQVIDERLKKYRAQFIGVEQFSTLPRWLDQATKINKHYLPSKATGTKLCIKETKWTAPVLKLLQEEMKSFRKETEKQPVLLRRKVGKAPSAVPTPEVEGVTEMEEEEYQSVILLQSIIRGRATQMMIYEGRDTCKELIQELRYTVGFLKKEKELRRKEKLRVKAQQREELVQRDMVLRLEGTLGRLQGSIVGTLLDFLNKELRRLLEERKAHAMCLVNERERYVREAAEAGRRQKELRRRREHDEMFRQIVKVTQDSVDMYLQDIITEGMEFASKEEAREYVTKLADRIERETNEAYEASKSISVDQQDEIIADMVHHFVVPEVQKNLIRNRIRQQQRENLKTIHNTIYSKFEDLPKIEYSKPTSPQSSTEATTPTTTESKAEEMDVRESDFIGRYQDPYDLYLTKLAEQQREGDDYGDNCYTFKMTKADDKNDLALRLDDLDTITEVDSESTSVNPPANTEGSSEEID
ncbi:cilia- and flagella-associated protein 91-like [Anoplophora glabripennis]|uniref:cilia- and flagella-associated protein 91-like n=1 Tax=Anoplophora glabripennis TaxID=217634 RepID=UPI00087550AE|nr:cilia- and flagella-associated protein 91-like [Anoplophora glabripennis]